MASSGRGSRSKGKSSELEFVHLIRPWWADAERAWQTPQRNGDIGGLAEWLYVECRRREALSVEAWSRDTEERAGDRFSITAWRRNHQPWRAAVPAIPLMALLSQVPDDVALTLLKEAA